MPLLYCANLWGFESHTNYVCLNWIVAIIKQGVYLTFPSTDLTLATFNVERTLLIPWKKEREEGGDSFNTVSIFPDVVYLLSHYMLSESSGMERWHYVLFAYIFSIEMLSCCGRALLVSFLFFLYQPLYLLPFHTRRIQNPIQNEISQVYR